MLPLRLSLHQVPSSSFCQKQLLKCFAVFALLFVAGSVISQPLLFPSNHKRYIIKTLNIETGLQNNTVNDIITDTFGFTWVATKTGLQRYNGYRLENVQPVINGFKKNIDYQVYFLPTLDHKLWVACNDGILQYNPFLDSFTEVIRYPASSSDEFALRPLEDTKQGVWCAGKKELVLYSHAGKALQRMAYPDTVTSSVDFSFCGAFNDRYLFLSTNKNRVLLFNKQTRAFSLLPLMHGGVIKFSVTGNRLYLLQLQGITFCKETNGVFTEQHTFYQTCRFPGTVKALENGAMASIDHHLLSFNFDCTEVSEIATLSGGPFLSAGIPKYIYQDKFNRLWILNSNDIRVILNYTVPFQYFGYKDAVNFGKSIYVDDEDNLVLTGYYNGGLQLFDTLTNPLWKTPLMTDKVRDVAGIEKLAKNEYFITTIGVGWFILNLKEKKLTPVLVSAEEEARLKTRSIRWTNNVQRLDSTILITTGSDVWQCRFLHNRILSAVNLFHDGSKSIFYSYYNAGNHLLWVGTGSGQVFCRHREGNTDTINIPGGYQVRCVITDAQNNAWIGTDKGLFIYNTNNKLIQSFTTANGLLNDCIYSMLTDKDKQTIYAGSNLGLSALRIGSIPKNYTKERGLQDNEFNSAANTSTAAGKLYFGGVNGFTAFYPADITVENDHPSLIIYDANINDEHYRTDTAIWNETCYPLTHSEDKISFSLTAFGNYQAADYAYQYKMDGFDKYWSTTSNPVGISYRLPPGTYYFKARLVNFPSQFITRQIVVAAPFWQRWWFYALIFLFVISTVWVIVRNSYQRHYKEQLQRLQIRQQILAERERISRDLHDNIGAYASAISANVDEVIYGPTKPNPATLKKLKESAREIIIQLRDSIWALNKETQTVIMLSDRIKNYIQKLQPAYPSISFDVEEEVEQNAIFPSITALNILRIVQEAVHNAIKHSGCSSIRVSISSCSPVVISVEDNGRGMPLSPVFGDGVKNMQSRAADIGWQVNISSQPGGCTIQLTNAGT